MEGTSELAIN